LKGPPLVRIESLNNRRGASPKKSARRVRFSRRAQKNTFDSSMRVASFNQHNIIDKSRPDGLASSRGFERSHLASSRDAFIALALHNTVQRRRRRRIRKPIAHSIEKSLFGSDFLSASHIRPSFNFSRRPGRSDAPPGSQGGANALLSSLCPNIRPANDQRIYPSFFPLPSPPPCPLLVPTRSFSSFPSVLPLDTGKTSAGNPKKWTVGFRCRAHVEEFFHCVHRVNRVDR